MLKEIYDFYPVSARIAFGVIFFFLGAGVGSFLGVFVSRTIRGEKWAGKERSKCENCGATLSLPDLIPVFSQLFLRSKCRRCHAHYSWGYIVPELLLGISFALGGCVLTDWVHIAVYFVFAAVLFAGAMFDFKTGFIPDGCAIIIAVLGAAVTVGAFVNPDVFDRFGQDLAAHLIGAVVISVPFLVLAFFGAMGVGDVLVMAAGGLLIGYSIIPAAFIGIFVGAIEGVIIKLGKFKEPESELETALRQLEEKLAALEQSKNERRSLTDFVNSSRDNEIEIKRVKREIEDAKRELETDDHPKGTVFRFIPALAFGLIVAYLFGGNIIDWYLNVFMQVE